MVGHMCFAQHYKKKIRRGWNNLLFYQRIARKEDEKAEKFP